MKNLSVYLAKQYIKKFYETLSLGMDKKEVQALKKSVEKYEDTSYIKEKMKDFDLSVFKNKYSENKNERIGRYEKLLTDIDEFYDVNFKGKEIIDVKVIKEELNNLSNRIIESLNDYEYLTEVSQLYEFKNNINVELQVYVDKHKSEEYMDMSIFHNSVTNIIKDNKNVISKLIEDNQKDEDEYVNLYLEKVYRSYSIIFDNSTGKITSIPGWAKGLLFCAPWIIGFCVFTIYPLIQTFIFSFSSVDISPDGYTTTFVGSANYINVLTSSTAVIDALKSHLIEMIVTVPVITIFALIFALLLNTKIKASGFFRTIFFFPVIITSGPIVKILFQQGIGSMPGINTLVDLDSLMAPLPDFLKTAINVLTSKFTLILWCTGIQTLVFLTSLQKIDKGVYEASAIDGASKWEQFWKVTLPAINPTIVINVVFTTVMQSIFSINPIIMMIQSQEVVYNGYGYRSALSFLYFAITVVILVVFVLIFKKHERKGRGNK